MTICYTLFRSYSQATTSKIHLCCHLPTQRRQIMGKRIARHTHTHTQIGTHHLGSTNISVFRANTTSIFPSVHLVGWLDSRVLIWFLFESNNSLLMIQYNLLICNIRYIPIQHLISNYFF